MSWLDNFTVKFTYSDNTTQIISSSDYLTSLYLSEQLNSAASDSDAAPISNMVMVGFDYAPTFWGKIVKGMKCEVFNGETRLGIFYLTDFTPPEDDEAIATITAYDLFYNLINREVIPTFEIVDNMSAEDYITAVFESVGIADDRLVFDPSFSDLVLNFSICEGKNLAEILTEFMLATDCFIYVGANENIIIQNKSISVEDEEYDELDDDSLSSLDLGSTFEEAYTGVKLTYNRFTIGEKETLLKTKTTLQPNTTLTLENLTLPSPLYLLSQIKTTIDCDISNVVSSQKKIGFSLSANLAEEETVEVELKGQFIKFVESFVVSEDECENPNYLELSSKMVQESYLAYNLAYILKERLNKRVIRCSMMPDDFDIELCKIMEISSIVKGLSPIYAYVHGYELNITEGDVELVLTLKELEGVEDNG